MDGQDGGSEPINPPNPQAGASPVPENSDGAMADNNATMGTGVGAGGALASTGGPIFSDPSLTIEKDAIPEEISGVEREMDTPVTAAVSGNAGRVAAAFASTDASRGAAMVPSGSNAMTQSTATGDIRLAPTPRKKMSKLPFIIGAGVLAIVVIVAVLLLMREGGGDSVISGNPKGTFDKYANYLLFGEEKEGAPGGEFDLDTAYEVDRQLASGEIDEKYWTRSRELLESAVSQYSTDEDSIDPDLGMVLGDYQKVFNFIDLYRQVGDFNESGMVTLYADSGAAAVETEIGASYTRYLESDLQTAKDYAEQRIQEYSAMLELYGIYDSWGCLRDGDVDESACTPDPSLAEEFTKLNETISEAGARADTILEQSIRSLKDGCWRLSNQLQTAQENQEADSKEQEDESEEDE